MQPFVLTRKKILRSSHNSADSQKVAEQYRFIDLFAGIGGFRIGVQRAGFSCVFSSEWDRFSAQSYQANFGETPAGDITAITSEQIPEHELLVAGFPCQPFSMAGVSKKNALGRPHGFLDQTQGTLFFDVARIIKDRQPRAFILENVKNLVHHDRGKTFAIILDTLQKELGYHLAFRVINAKHYLPQNRERIFIVGFKDQSAASQFTFPPTPRQAAPAIGALLEAKVDPKYTLSDKLWGYLQSYKEKHQRMGHGFGFGLTEPDGIARTLSARYYKDGSEILIPQPASGANPRANPRRLTPRECARLMGFPESYRIVVSDTQAYKQFGNSVAVPVVQRVASRVMRALQRADQLATYRTTTEHSSAPGRNTAETSGRRRKVGLAS